MAMFEALLSGSQDYSGTSYATITGLALTPGAGTYLCIMTIGIASSALSEEYFYVALAVDGTEEADTEREKHNESSIAEDNTTFTEMVTHKVITVGAGEEIQARWKGSAAGSMYASYGGLTLIEVAVGDVDQVVSVTNDTGIGSTPAQVDGMLFTNPSSDDYLAVFSCSTYGGTIDEAIHIAIYVGGAEVAHTERRIYMESSLKADSSYPILCVAKVSPNGSQNVQIYAWTDSSSTGVILERTFTLLGNRTLLQVSGTIDDTESTSGTDKAIDDLTHVNPPAGDYLAIGSLVNSYGSIGAMQDCTLKLFEETTEVTNSARHWWWNDSLDNMDRCLPMAQKVSPDGAEDVSMQWRGNTTDTRTCSERTFVLMLDAAAAVREQEGYRWRQDNADEDEADWLVAQDTDITRAKSLNTRLRVLMDTDATADPPAEGVQLEYRKVGDAATEWRKVPTA